MVVYLDLLFIFNFLINSIFLYVVELIYQERISMVRIILGGLVGGLLILGFMFDYYLYYLLKIGGGVLVGYIGFKGENVLKKIVKVASFYIINFASVGLISSFNIGEWYLFCASTFILILIFFIENNKKSHIFINQFKYNISVSFNNTRLKLEGYLDTGNFSKCDGLPIIYLSKKFQPKFTVYKVIKINTVNGISLNSSYKPTSFIINVNKNKIEKEVLVVFTDLKDFDCLLNAELFI